MCLLIVVGCWWLLFDTCVGLLFVVGCCFLLCGMIVVCFCGLFVPGLLMYDVYYVLFDV